MRLGKLPYRHDDRTLALANYVDRSVLPKPPASFRAAAQPQAWGMYLNDRVSCCTVAAASHMLISWSGGVDVPKESDALTLYEQVSGYDPQTGANDNGAVELDVLNAWRKTGLGGRQIGAFAKVRLDPASVKAACWLFGGLYGGAELPDAVLPNGGVRPWVFPRGAHGPRWQPNPNNGHAWNIIGYDTHGLTVVTWGQELAMSWSFLTRCVDELWAIIDVDWLKGGKTAAGFDVAALTADLAALR